jgi:PIN domain nuclease of toxin-antitoxin system
VNYLLDTHAFLWSLFEPEKLSKSATDLILSPENDISVSVVSFWEISLKYAIGKLELHRVLPDEMPYYAEQMGVSILPIDPFETSNFYKLPRRKHKDPFDRLMVWQAIQNNIILLTRDRTLGDYRSFGLKTYW